MRLANLLRESSGSAPRTAAETALSTRQAAAGTSQPRGSLKSLVTRAKVQSDIESARKRDDAMTYDRIMKTIDARYKDFNPETQVGHGGQPGVSGDIADITRADVQSMIRHIAANPDLLQAASKKSAVSPLFTKIYIREGEGGDNLRLHLYAPGGTAQDSEARQHGHRWRLDSLFMAGGFNNMNWEKTADPGEGHPERFHQYELEKTPKNADTQKFSSQGWVGLKLEEQRMFRQGQLRSYEIERLHSVGDTSQHTGTGITLAHTAKAQHDTSVSFRTQAGIESEPLGKSDTTPEKLGVALKKVDAFFRLHTLSEGLSRHLADRDPATLTPQEKMHMQDNKAPNYLETSLMPALAILKQAQDAGEHSTEFSPQTVAYINDHMKRVDSESMNALQKDNQGHIAAQHYSTEVNSWEQMVAKVEGDKPRS